MTTTPSSATMPNPEAIEALAQAVLRSVVQDGYEDDDSSSDLAIALVLYSQKSQRYIKQDDRFPGLPHTSMREQDHFNNIGAWFGFRIGFDLALQLGARIACAPLEEIETKGIIAEAVVRHFEALRKLHNEHAGRKRYTQVPA